MPSGPDRGGSPRRQIAPGDSAGLQGKRVLVVEDDYMIAFDMVDGLTAAGAVPVGPCGWIADALALLDRQAGQIDLAVVDVDLHGQPSYPVADVLIRMGVPFAFVTGFNGETLDLAYRDFPRFEKPVSVRTLERAFAPKA